MFNQILVNFNVDVNKCLVVILGCVCLGYIIKNTSFFKFICNNDIPFILAIFGTILYCLVEKVSVVNCVFGCFMGLSSVGLHQLFKHFIEVDIAEWLKSLFLKNK